MHKIEIYQRIAAVRNEDHISSLLDELIDRFGEPTVPVLRLLDVARIKNYARNLGIKSIVGKERMIELTLTEQHSIEPERVIALKNRLGAALMLLAAQRMMRVRFKTKISQDELLKFLLSTLQDLSGETAESKKFVKGANI